MPTFWIICAVLCVTTKVHCQELTTLGYLTEPEAKFTDNEESRTDTENVPQVPILPYNVQESTTASTQQEKLSKNELWVEKTEQNTV